MKIIIFLIPVLYTVIAVLIKIIYPSIYYVIIQEDSVIEYLQAIVYFISALISLSISIRFLRMHFACESAKYLLHAILYSFLFMSLVFISIEEISYGQRLFDIDTPEFFIEHNHQHEISVHNLKFVQSVLHMIYILVGLYGAMSWLLLRFINLPLNHIIQFIYVEWFISSYFLSVFLLYSYFELISCIIFKISQMKVFLVNGGFIVWRDQEPAEFLLSLGFLIFVVTKYYKSKALCSGSVNKHAI